MTSERPASEASLPGRPSGTGEASEEGARDPASGVGPRPAVLDGAGRSAGEESALEFLQGEIESIYGVTAPRVLDFLVGRRRASDAVGPVRTSELLLVREAEGVLELGLFLDDAVLAGAGAADPDDPRRLLTRPGVLAHVVTAAEGVSHFVYLASRAARGRSVSLLELEVQAEVDKFALLVLHLWRRGHRRRSAALRRRLFQRVAYLAHLDPGERERYRLANRLGGGYARWLEARYVEPADSEGLVRELRASYRLGAGEKLGYLEARASEVRAGHA